MINFLILPLLARTLTQAGVITDIVLLSCVGIKCVLVHGGGPEINFWLDKVGIKPEFKNGLRVTDGEGHSRHWRGD
jgi:acetylglutamate kinase